LGNRIDIDSIVSFTRTSGFVPPYSKRRTPAIAGATRSLSTIPPSPARILTRVSTPSREIPASHTGGGRNKSRARAVTKVGCKLWYGSQRLSTEPSVRPAAATSVEGSRASESRNPATKNFPATTTARRDHDAGLGVSGDRDTC
jgi:hypothetical protein